MTTLQIALKLLNEYEENAKYVNLSLQSHIADGLDASERAKLTALLYTTVERKLTYDYYISYLSSRRIDEIDTNTKNILRLGLCMLLDMDTVPDFAAVNSAVSLSERKSATGFINGVLRRAAREREALPLPSQEKKLSRYLSVAYSVPQPTVKLFLELFGEKTEALLSSMNESRGLSIAVNTKKISRESYLKLLKEKNISARASVYSTVSIVLDKSYNPEKLPGFEDGYFFVQDEACTAAVEALGITAGATVIDTCAAPGGKSFAAAILSDGIRVYSFDISESKLPLISSGAERLALTEISCAVNDAKEPRLELIGKADFVICDVPCSGLGVFSKKPDIRYKDISNINELPPLQYEILLASSRYLSSAGTLLYSTCTLNRAENEDVVNRFISENKDFELADFAFANSERCEGMFTFLPHEHKTDGFFVAKIRKKTV